MVGLIITFGFDAAKSRAIFLDMARDLKKQLESYNYHLPQSAIAQKPPKPRDAARLLIYDPRTKNIDFDRFANIGHYLPKNSLLVLNDTKVVPARLYLRTESDQAVEILYLAADHESVKALANRHLPPKTKLFYQRRLLFEVVSHNTREVKLRPFFPIKDLFGVLKKYGNTPIPPYIKSSPLSEESLRQEYQTVFARSAGSVAAPTASLHFTKRLLDKLVRNGVELAYITLHVNLGTFAPLQKENITQNKLHEEYFRIDATAARQITTAKQSGKKIIAVGTTMVRALESAGVNGLIKPGDYTTSLFIRPGYKLKVVDGLITNFHVPRSSLMMLVANFTGRRELLRIYQRALAEGCLFFSFGDAMMVMKKDER